MKTTITRDDLCAICDILGADRMITMSITLTPSAALVTTIRHNGDGHAYVDPETKSIATDFTHIAVVAKAPPVVCPTCELAALAPGDRCDNQWHDVIARGCLCPWDETRAVDAIQRTRTGVDPKCPVHVAEVS